MSYLSQEGSKKTFIDTSFLLQPNATWDVMVEPFAGSAALSMAFGELYPDRDLVIGDTDHTIINALQQVRDNLHETQDWCWRYARCLEREDGGKWLWGRWTKSRDNPEEFSAPQRAALRIHAGPIGSLPALNARGRKTGFSPARAGYRDSSRWVASHADTIAELPRWSAVLQRAEVRRSNYRETVTTVISGDEKAFWFVDSPYRYGCKGKVCAGDAYYGAPFDVDELGKQCNRINEAGHFAMVTLDWCDENAVMFDANWTVMRGRWKSYGGTKSQHLIAINYTPLLPLEEIAALRGWEIKGRG